MKLERIFYGGEYVCDGEIAVTRSRFEDNLTGTHLGTEIRLSNPEASLLRAKARRLDVARVIGVSLVKLGLYKARPPIFVEAL